MKYNGNNSHKECDQMTLLLLSIISLTIALSCILITFGYFHELRRKTKIDPIAKLNELVNQQAEHLRIARTACQASETFIRDLERTKSQLTRDLDVLDKEINESIKKKDRDLTKILLQRKNRKETLLENCTKRLNTSRENHEVRLVQLEEYKR